MGYADYVVCFDFCVASSKIGLLAWQRFPAQSTLKHTPFDSGLLQ